MLEIMKFVFSSFWIWSGSVILILSAGVVLNSVIVGFRGKVVTLVKATGSDD
ncbi:MAG: hypothetical protein V3V47_01860 [Desulfobacteria bacterium]